MRFAKGTNLTVLRNGGRDARGNARPDTEHTLLGWAVTPRTSDEASSGRSDVPVTGAVARGPMNASWRAIDGLRSTDRIRVPAGHELAGTWSIEGDPGPFRSPFSGWAAGARAALTRG